MKVINLKTYRVVKEQQRMEMAYRYQLLAMDKATLLQELLNYHESYMKDPHDVNITLRGQHLMEVLEQRAELKELQEIAQEFKNKLQLRLYGQMQQMSSQQD